MISHELGHTLGLNHQPTTHSNLTTRLLNDDPDNNPLTPDDSNNGLALMGYPDESGEVDNLLELGTANLSAGELAVGQIDTADLLIRWFS